MPTNLAIDDTLLRRALKLGQLKTKKETVTEALKEFIERREQKKIIKNLGSIRFREDWNYKRDRNSR
ncbi:MAG: type II toxin-antitoxin system VapB family antitoxin [Deltaproteobacteria bacterium]|nr:type II toxin-antitoxin system VapB family antitoxin [Deltaproteobacteria bacterium]